MLEIETTPRRVENIRSTSIAMRKLPILSSAEYDDLVISFSFGLLTVQFAASWSDAWATLKIISERSGAKVWETAFARLRLEGEENVASPVTADHQREVKFSIADFADELWTVSAESLRGRLQALYDTVFTIFFFDNLLGDCKERA
jgi:hypothetical protein